MQKLWKKLLHGSSRIACVGAFLCLLACQAQWYGTGQLHIHNGTPKPATILVQGNQSTHVQLTKGHGRCFKKYVAGKYNVTISQPGVTKQFFEAELKRGEWLIVNVDRRGCFARVDIAGLYDKNKAPVRVLQTYTASQVFSLPDTIDVVPGEKPPGKRAKSPYPFQRLLAVPCTLLDDARALDQYLRSH